MGGGRKSLTARHREAIVLLTGAGGTFGLICGFFGMLDWLKVDLEWLKALHWFAVYLLVLHSMIGGLVVLAYRRLRLQDLKEAEALDQRKDSSALASEVAVSLKAALDAHRYLEVIRIGSVLSRPLFESGSFKARLAIGSLVEEAAAAVDDQHAQMMELIDSIGWSCVELGELDRAREKIQHGLKIAIKLKDEFYISKAKRHLGVICRRKEDYAGAAKLYAEAFEAARRVTDENQRRSAFTGLQYAQASLHIHRSEEEYEEALHVVDEAIDGSKQSKDSYRLTMALTLKGEILFRDGKLADAKDTLRKALHSAEAGTQRLLAARSLIGLTKISMAEHDWEKANENLEHAAVHAQEINSEGELAAIRSLRRQLPAL
jgi:tetratricopeptide (TPR) repeat protein